MEWFEYLLPNSITGVVTFVSIFSLGVFANIKAFSLSRQQDESGF